MTAAHRVLLIPFLATALLPQLLSAEISTLTALMREQEPVKVDLQHPPAAQPTPAQTQDTTAKPAPAPKPTPKRREHQGVSCNTMVKIGFGALGVGAAGGIYLFATSGRDVPQSDGTTSRVHSALRIAGGIGTIFGGLIAAGVLSACV